MTLDDAHVRLSESVCPLHDCKAPRIVLSTSGSIGLRAGGRRERLEVPPRLDPTQASQSDDELTRRSIWTKGMALEHLADPCLLVAAGAMGMSTSELSLWIAHVLRSVIGEPGWRRVCKHAIELDGRLCTTLAHERRGPGGDAVVGLIHVADLVDPSPPKPADDVMVLDPAIFEASPQESALSYHELMALDEKWISGNCEAKPVLTEPRPRKDWGHMLFVSHAWKGDEPGTEEDLEQIKRVVKGYTHEALRILSLSPDELAKDPNPYGIKRAVVKNVKTLDDFGIWIDYMLVPNDPAHQGCPRCQAERDRHIAQIGALLTISTIIAMDPKLTDRGWIIHELTGNSHDNIVDGRKMCRLDASDLRHRHRAHLMDASTELFRVPSDGVKLRRYEFPRLGQLPRCWPAVNVELLAALKAASVPDEREPEAAPLLYRYARHFDLPCHELKLAMIEVPQALARLPSSPAMPIDLERFTKAVEHQAEAMRELHQQLAPGPEQDHGLLLIDDAVELVRRLQTHQLVEVALGLRAETTRQAGFGSWVKLTEIVDALAVAKFMGRLFKGIVTQKKVSCNVTLDDSAESRLEGPAWEGRLVRAAEVVQHGVRIDALLRAHHALDESATGPLEAHTNVGTAGH